MREEEERQQGINFAKNNILKFYIYKRSLNDKLHYRINLKKNIRYFTFNHKSTSLRNTHTTKIK